MPETCVKSVVMSNGLTLVIEDFSRRISDDAFVVKICFSMETPVTDEAALVVKMDRAKVMEIIDSETIRFEKIMEKNFVKEADVDEVKATIINSYMKTNETYLSHDKFASGVLRTQVVAKMRKKGLLY